MVREQLQMLNALDATKMQWYHFMAIVIAGMGFFTDAYHLFCIFLTTKVLCFFTGDYHDLHQFMMFLVSEPLFSTLLLSYLALVVIVIEYPDATPRDVKFSVKPSSKGRSDIQSGSDTIRVPKCFSEHHPLIQLVLLAEKKWASFYYPKALAPKCVVLDSGAYDTTKPDTDTKSSIESCTVSLETLRTIAGSFHGTDSCSTMQNQLNVNNPGHEHNNDPRSNGASEITSSLETTLVPVVNEHGETEMEYYSNPDTVAAESGVIKADEPKTSATWVLATAALHHATADRALLSSFVLEHGDHFVHVADGSPMQVLGRGNVVTDVMVLPDVWYVPGLTANLVSVSQLAELDYSVEFGRGACYVRSAADCRAVGAARAGEDGLFEVDYLKVPFSM